jgi:hypothetical protein
LAEQFTIDIATRVVGPDEDIYVMQPGEDYWLYNAYDRYSRVFLDFPDLVLNFKEVPSDSALRLQVVRSMVMANWIADGKVGKAPSSNLADYEGMDFGRRLGRYVGAIKRLYFELPAGTIIVVPGKHYYDDVLIGELTGKAHTFARKGIYDGASMPARKIRWLRRKPRSAFSPAVRERFGTPNPIMQLDRSLRAEVLKAGFDQYAYEGTYAARLNTTSDDFSTLDDYNIQTFVNYVTGLLAADELGRTGELSLSEAISILKENPELAVALAQNINSVGFQRLIDSTVRPIVIALLFTAALDPASATAKPQIQVTNSAASSGDICKIEVQARIEGALRLMKLEEWKRVCESARDAHRATGLTTTMHLRKGAKPARNKAKR